MWLLRITRLVLLLFLLLSGVFLVLLNSVFERFRSQPSILTVARVWYRLLLAIMNVKVICRGRYAHQGLLICSNHISWLDIPILGSQLPTYFLSKAEVRDVPILGWLAKHAGTLFIHRGKGQITEVKQLIQNYLSQDHCLTFFPEATTGNGHAIRQFHPRLFASAIESATPLLPVSLRYITDTQPDLRIDFGDESMGANVWRVLGRWQTRVEVTLLPVIDTRNEERKKLADKAMHCIADSLNLPAERRGLSFREPLPEAPDEDRLPPTR